jgi:GDP-4-dehydro-6-deoxy-D-mannose reductase
MDADLTERGAVDRLVAWAQPEAIVHLAGLAAVGPSFADPQRYVAVNMGAQINLFEACLARKLAPRVLVVSSGTLYAPTDDLPLTEASEVRPGSPYAVSKLGQEQLAGYYAMRDFECVVSRPFNHIGPGQGLGFLASDLAEQIARAEKTGTGMIRVGNLEAKRDYTDVRDIVRAYRLLVELEEPAGIYNICSGRSWSGQEILDRMMAFSKAELKVEVDPTRVRPSDNPEVRGDYAKLHGATGWKPAISLEDSLRDVVEDWRGRAAEG